jgi:hypothetical protein
VTMRRDDLPRHPTATFVLPRWQTMYVSVNKAACTTLKWLVAEIQGEQPERFHGSLWDEVSRPMTIHQRRLWQHTPMALRMTEEELAPISPENGWFVFGVVRHPSARLFSAWQSKLLLREPWWTQRYGDADWFPRVPRSGDDVVEDFARFTRALAAGDAPLMRNRHFAPQRRLLRPKRVSYSRIYRTSELPELLRDFEAHLRERGWEGEGLQLRRTNETPLPAITALFGPEVQAAAGELYRADFKAFGYDDVVPGGLADGGYGDEAIAEVVRLIERSERIGDLAARARSLRSELRTARTPAPPPPPTVGQRLKRRLAGR